MRRRAILLMATMGAAVLLATGVALAQTFVTKWGSQGTGDGQFQFITDVATDSSGNVYVADQINYRVQKFSSTGGFITKWGSQGTADGQFVRPHYVATDSSGSVYVADTHNHRIQKFSSTGSFIAKWGNFGTGDGQFRYPYGVATDSSHNVYVVDANNFRVQKFSQAPPVPATPSTPDLDAASDSGDPTDNITNVDPPTFTGTADEGSTVKIYVDGVEVGRGTATGGNYSITTDDILGEGNHSVTATASNASGESGPSQPLNITIDQTAPDTTISSGPSGITNSKTAEFVFESSEQDSTFECSTDGTNYDVCSSPQKYENLADGSYTFYVRAIDKAGNEDDTPAEQSFTVDTTPPDTTITRGPANNSTQRSNSATFEFSTTSPENNASYKCSLDGGSYVACTSPETYTNLSEGPHTFSVKATDEAGNEDASADTRSWTVDLIPTVVSIDTSQDASNNTLRNTDITIIFSEGMDHTTLENAANYRLNKQGSKRTVPVGVKSVSADNRTVVLDPYPGKRNVLAKNTTYTVTVLSGVKDNEQNPLASNYSENFTTGSS